MKEEFSREVEYLRVGHLTYYVLKIIEGLPKVGMQAYYALIFQELESENRLGAGKSLLYTRLKYLCENKFIKTETGASSNPKAKKKVQFFYITQKGQNLLKKLANEQKRITDSMRIYN